MRIKKMGEWIHKNEMVINWVLIIAGVFYFYSMFVHPFFGGQKNCIDLDYVQKVWKVWQPLNVGVLAFTSSYIIFLAATFSEEAKRSRAFRADRAMLPHALSEIVHYTENGMDYVRSVGLRINAGSNDVMRSPPELPNFYKDVFRKCIGTADEDDGEYLAGIIVRMQIINSRLRKVSKASPHRLKEEGIDFDKVKSLMCDLAEIYAMVANFFPFARGEEDRYEKNWLSVSSLVKALEEMNVRVNSHGNIMRNIEKTIAVNGMMYK